MTCFRQFVYATLLLFLAAPLPFGQSNAKTAQLTFTTVDFPGAGVTGVTGINTAGDMVGYYGVNDNEPHKHGFLLRNGTFTSIDYPGAYATFAYGINDSGLIVGSAEFNSGLTALGFTYDGTTFTPFQVPHQPVTTPNGIDNAGDIVGSAGISGANFHGFELRAGHFKLINFPGQYIIASANSINNLGEIAGYTIDGTPEHAYSYRNGKSKNLDFPGAIQTQALGINDNGVIVGWYGVGGLDSGFALRSGKYLSFSYPGAKGTFAVAINASGQIVGQYTLDFQTYHGFVTSPIDEADFQ
jgi:uncharacterized membrane protein